MFNNTNTIPGGRHSNSKIPVTLRNNGASDEVRTHDLLVGNEMLYH